MKVDRGDKLEERQQTIVCPSNLQSQNSYLSHLSIQFVLNYYPFFTTLSNYVEFVAIDKKNREKKMFSLIPFPNINKWEFC